MKAKTGVHIISSLWASQSQAAVLVVVATLALAQ